MLHLVMEIMVYMQLHNCTIINISQLKVNLPVGSTHFQVVLI